MGGLFGAAYEAPEVPEPEPMPNYEEQEPVSQAVRDEERRKLRSRRLMSGTLLTSPLGTTTNSASGLLGRV